MSRKSLMLAAAREGDEQALEALKQAGYSRRLSPQMRSIALDTALELFDEFSDEISEAGIGATVRRHPALVEVAEAA